MIISVRSQLLAYIDETAARFSTNGTTTDQKAAFSEFSWVTNEVACLSGGQNPVPSVRSRTAHGRNRRKDPNVFYKKWMIIMVLFFIALCTLCILFLKMGRASADSDPLLDPRFNPNIRVEEAAEDTHSVLDTKSKFEKKVLNENMKELLPA
ncbi:hypothetical protein TNCV_3922871 [Trichonephila clavipes]|nr:hypothetical protein TNCV_3922871 [Trichonephila clavipes]